MRLASNVTFCCLLACELLLASSPACVSGTLASYMALGANGCTLSGIVFANFSYTASASGGATKIGSEHITVTPTFVVPETARFSFSAPWKVGNEQSQESVIKYTAVLPCGDMRPAELDLALGVASVGGIIGSVTVNESTNVGALSVFDRCTEICQTKTNDRLQLEPVSVLLVTDHVKLSGGNGGASLNEFTSALNLCIPCV
jgi:hypothetical protein